MAPVLSSDWPTLGVTVAKDRFSQLSDDYRRYRPGYPQALFDAIAKRARGRDLAWDCGCGSGQASVALARRFAQVLATDLSWQQLSRADAAERVYYSVATAELPPLAPASVDAVLVAQALHWFDLPAFFSRCEQVLKPGGLLVVVTYNLLTVSPAVDAIIEQLYRGILGDYWDAERRLVENGYRDIRFPFEAVEFPTLTMQEHWSVEDLLGYLATWSALGRYRQATGRDAIAEITPALRAAWPPSPSVQVTWPLRCIVRRKTDKDSGRNGHDRANSDS